MPSIEDQQFEKSIKWPQPKREEESDGIVDDLDPTEDGEASEETHCPSNQTQLGLSCHLCIIFNISQVMLHLLSLNITFTSLSISSYDAVSKKIYTASSGEGFISVAKRRVFSTVNVSLDRMHTCEIWSKLKNLSIRHFVSVVFIGQDWRQFILFQ